MKFLSAMACKLGTILCFSITAGCTAIKCHHCAVQQLIVDHFPPLFAHRQYTNQVAGWRYIYLEGDGRPWKRGYIQSNNPTSQQKLALQLMMASSHDSIYLERPCYGFDQTPPPPCRPHWWTSARYNQLIADALNNALDQTQREHGHKPLVLIGHSGGATLAMLMAQQRDDVVGIVTLAGNIDPDAWTKLHHYLPLTESSNPSKQNPLPNTVFRWHYAGKNDRNIPPSLVKNAITYDPFAKLSEMNGDHNCCWLGQWPSIHKQLRQLEEASTNGGLTRQSTP